MSVPGLLGLSRSLFAQIPIVQSPIHYDSSILPFETQPIE